MMHRTSSSVTLGNSLDLILLLHGVRVGLTDTLRGSDDFVTEHFSHALVRSEASLSRSFANQIDSLVHSSKWRHINSLSSHGTAGTNSGGVLSSSTLDDSFKKNFEWILSRKQMNDFESLSENSDSDLFLTVLSVHTNHELIDESFGDWAGDFLESLLLIFTSSVWDVHLGFNTLYREVVRQRLLRALDTFISPFSKKHWFNSELTHRFFDFYI